MNQSNVIVDSVASVKKHLKDEEIIDVKDRIIREVMKYDLGMRYRKITNVS